MGDPREVLSSCEVAKKSLRWARDAAAFILTAGLSAGCAEKIVVSDSLSTPDTQVSDGKESFSAVYSLPKTVVSISSTVDANGNNQTYTITPSIVPDKDARYRLRYVPTDLSDDSITLGVDQNGLLSSVVASATGRQGDIIVAIATTAASVATLAGGGVPTKGVEGVEGVKCPYQDKQLKTFTVVYDLDQFNNAPWLPDCSKVTIDWTRASNAPKVQNPSCEFSVCYRALTTVSAKISRDNQVKEAKFVAVDPNFLEGLNLESAPFVARTHTITFTSGLLTSAVLSDPSVALAVAQLPMTVVQAVLKAPSALITLQANNVQAEQTLVSQQTALINAQIALQKALAASKPATPVAGSGSSP